MAGESVEALGDIDQLLEPVIVVQQFGKFTQLRLALEGRAKITGIEAPNVFGHKTDLVICQPERQARITRRPTCAVGVLHGHQAHAGTSVALKDGAIDLVAPR